LKIAVSFYAKKLQEVDTTFPKHPEIRNGPVKQRHSYILNTSNLPASVQQRYLIPKDKQIRSQVCNLLLRHFLFSFPTTHFSSNCLKLFKKQVAGHVGSDHPQNLKRQQSPRTTPPVPQASGYHSAVSSPGTKRLCIQSPKNSIPFCSGNINFEPLNDTDENFSSK
jgi:hypothetical protein